MLIIYFWWNNILATLAEILDTSTENIMHFG